MSRVQDRDGAFHVLPGHERIFADGAIPERAATREPVGSHRLRGLAKSESIVEIEAVAPQKRPSVFLLDVLLQRSLMSIVARRLRGGRLRDKTPLIRKLARYGHIQLHSLG
jgi:hypothetical protein